MSFTNRDEFSLADLQFNIIAIPDDNGEKIYYQSKDALNLLEPGKSIDRSFRQKEIEFLNNITIVSTLYIDEGKVNLKNLTTTLTKDDTFS